MLTNRVADTPRNHKRASKIKPNFEGILRGTVNGFRFLGIPLDPSSIRSPIVRYWAIGFGLFMFIFNLVANMSVLISEVKNFDSSTKRLNRLINEGNFAITLMIVYAAVLFRTAPYWKGLLNVLYEIEELYIFETEDFDNLRRIFLKGNIISLLLVLSNMAFAVFLLLSFTTDLIIHPIQFFSVNYLSIGITLFITLGCAVSNMIHILGTRKVLLMSANSEVNRLRWCRCIGLLVELVNQINRCFGPLLLAALVYYFILLVNGTFYGVLRLQEKGLLDSSAWMPFVIQIIIFPIFLFTLYFPHRILQEKQKLARKLFMFQSTNESVHQLNHHLELRALLSPVHITAMGLVNFDLTLVPNMIGTCLTYIIVLAQFKSSERNDG